MAATASGDSQASYQAAIKIDCSHRLRHTKGFWLLFHQIQHSPSRIEVLTSFDKHPVEIAADSIIASYFIYFVFGGTALAGAWSSLFGAAGEYFYHANIRTPRWLRCVSR